MGRIVTEQRSRDRHIKTIVGIKALPTRGQPLGAIAAVLSKSRIDAPDLVAKMLCGMQHRAQDGAAVAWDGNLESASTPSRLSLSSTTGNSAIGYGFTRILPGDDPQPVRAGEGWLCLDGRIVAHRMLVGGEEAARLLENKLTPVEFSSIQHTIDGAYSLCFCTSGGLLVTRDPLGLKPVFIGSRNGLVAVASDRKALWAIGIREATTLPPGGCLKASPEKSTVESPEPQLSTSQALRHEQVKSRDLLRLLVESVSIQTAGLDAIAAGFSGGLDSTVLAKIAKDAGVDTLLVTVGVGKTAEMSVAESTADAIGLPIVTKQFSTNDVAEALDRVLWLVEEPSLMKVSIAMAIQWTAHIAQENGRSVVMLGQGSDELFGGYNRFATILGERGAKACEEAISESVRDAHEVNFQRDEQAVSPLRAELRLPFATQRITESASRVPLTMKVRSPSDNLRKWILRDVALELGISSVIALRPKKAIQHASGVEKAIREIAKKRGLTSSAYLEQRFRMMKREFDARNACQASVASY
jgi:asparagine synthase (glutamine-hydrolysing)